MVEMRQYVVGVLTGVIASLAIAIVAPAVSSVLAGMSVLGKDPAQPLSLYDSGMILFQAILIAIAALIAIYMAIYITEYQIGYRSFKKFSFFLNKLNQINEIATTLEGEIREQLEAISRVQKYSIPREFHVNEMVNGILCRALRNFLQMIPDEYENAPSVRTASIMLRRKYLDGESLDGGTQGGDPFAGDALEVFHYVEHTGLNPVLSSGFNSLQFEIANDPALGEIFAIRSAREGAIRMGHTKPWRTFPWLRKSIPFRFHGDVDSGKRSILNIPLTNKKYKVIGVLSIDASSFQFVGSPNSNIYIKNILSNFIDKLEISMILICNETNKKSNIS